MLTGRHTDADEAHHHLMVRGARLVERQVVALEVAGSNPVTHPKNSTSVRFS